MSTESQNCERSRQPLLGNGYADTLIDSLQRRKQTSVARQCLSKRQVTAATLTYATIEALLEAMFSLLSVPRRLLGSAVLEP
jgi:hypothetical protein